MGTYRLTAHSFVAIRLTVGIIVFTPGTQLNIYVLSISVTSEHWKNSSAAGWLQLLIFGMGFQLMWFYMERLLNGALYWKMYSIVYAVDLYCMCMRFITVNEYVTMYLLPSFGNHWIISLLSSSMSITCITNDDFCAQY